MRIDFLEVLRQRRVRACFRDAVDGYRALDMVLVTNGHGGRDMALIPRVNSGPVSGWRRLGHARDARVGLQWRAAGPRHSPCPGVLSAASGLCIATEVGDADFSLCGVFLQELLMRCFRYHDMIGYTMGSGHLVPVRFNCPPEITPHHLHLSNRTSLVSAACREGLI